MIVGDPANGLAGKPEPSRIGDHACPREINQQGKTRNILDLLQFPSDGFRNGVLPMARSLRLCGTGGVKSRARPANGSAFSTVSFHALLSAAPICSGRRCRKRISKTANCLTFPTRSAAHQGSSRLRAVGCGEHPAATGAAEVDQQH